MDDLIEREGMQILLPPASGVDGEFLDGWCAGQAYLIANYGTDEAFDRAADVANRIAALEALLKEAGEALALLVTDEKDDPCWFDHHGNCQAHMVNNPCEMAIARATLAKLQEPGHDDQ